MDHLEDRHRWNDNIKIEIKEMFYKLTNTHMAMVLRLCLANLRRICN
jgi:hypothetical protein